MIEPKKIRKDAEENFEKAWIETASLLPKDTKIKIKEKGKSHPVRNMIERSRKLLLEQGFTEVENRTILSEKDVYAEYGPEAPVILDRSFYLAKLPRPDLGLDNQKIEQIRKIIGDFDVETVQTILRNYKRGAIESDDFVEALVGRLNIKTEQATSLIQNVFPEFKELKPIPTDLTLRSHMTATWYHTLSAMQNQAKFPLALFSIGPRYRNEQREDLGHLRVHHSISIVMMDPNMSLDAGREITREILEQYGFKELEFRTKEATSKYYAPGQEEEIFAKHKGKWFEIADIGMYSPISLANFNIRYPVFNAGFGLERLVMVLEDVDDIRKLVYPQFYGKGYNDKEIAEAIQYICEPSTLRGRKIAESIEEFARKEKDRNAPCEVTAWEDDLVKVKIVEDEEDKKLIGPAGLNYVCVRDGNIYADVSPSGTPTGKSYILGIANAVAYHAEKNNLPFTYKVKVARSLTDLNMQIPDEIREFIQKDQKRINVKGYVFTEVGAESKNKNLKNKKVIKNGA